MPTKTTTKTTTSSSRVSKIEQQVLQVASANERIARAIDRMRKEPSSGRSMATPAELRRQLRVWLVRHKLDRGTRMFTQEQWIDQRSRYGNPALVSMTLARAPLFDALHDPKTASARESFFDLAEQLGYFGEFGTGGASLHFYPLHR